jgi:hypothetical protein
MRLNPLSTSWKQFKVEIACRMERVTSGNLVSQSEPSSVQDEMLSTSDLSSKPASSADNSIATHTPDFTHH